MLLGQYPGLKSFMAQSSIKLHSLFFLFSVSEKHLWIKLLKMYMLYSLGLESSHWFSQACFEGALSNAFGWMAWCVNINTPAALLSLSVLRLVTEPGAVLGGRPDLLHHIAGTVLGGYGSICRGDDTEPLSQLYLFRRCSDEKQPVTCSTEFILGHVPGVTCRLLLELLRFVRSLPGSSVWPLVLEWSMSGRLHSV